MPTIISNIELSSSAQLGKDWPRLRNASGSSKNRRSRFPNELGFGGRGGRTGRGVGCGRGVAVVRVEVADLGVVLVVVLVAPDVVLVVFPVAVLGFAGVAILDEAALVLPVEVVLVVPAADLAPVPVALVVLGVLLVPVGLAALVVLAVPVVLLDVADLAPAGGVFCADVREDTAEALPVVFLLISLDGVWATLRWFARRRVPIRHANHISF